MALLETKKLSYSYNNIQAIKDIDLYVDEGEIVTIIGANGAGKSTTLKSISGLLDSKGKSGTILFDGKDITRMPGNRIVKEGVIQVLEGRHIFSQLTVHENMIMGAYLRNDNLVDEDIEKMYVKFPRLKERKDQMGGTLSGGEQQMLAIARAVISKPRILLMDEPSLGLAPIFIKEIFDTIRQINKEDGTTILLVEQNSKMALNVADRGYVLQNGEIVISGRSSDLLNEKKIQQAYLGIS